MTYKGDKANPFGLGSDETPDIQDVDKALYGSPAPPPSGRVVAKPIPIAQIWPDLTQPRKIVPAATRRGWDGSPAGIRAMVGRWEVLVQRYLKDGERLDVAAVLAGEDFIDVNVEEAGPVVQNFIGMVELATNINEQGLNMPITVAKMDANRYLLHTGERRFMAHQLLNIYLGSHDKIAAIEREHNVWSQVAENTQRNQMNAVSMARSLAKLIMAMYADEMTFREYGEMLTPEGSDRPYYAQAADLRIKRGMGEQVRNALNLTSDAMVSRYNKLLTLPDDIWMLADEENLSETHIRTTYIAPKREPPQSPDTFTTVKVSPSERPTRAIEPRGHKFGHGEHLKPVGTPKVSYDEPDFINADELGPPPRTVIGERMGLYDSPHPPAPEAGQGAMPGVEIPEELGDPAEWPTNYQYKGRPVITRHTSDADFTAAGYVYCPHPSEFEFDDETWEEIDELQAAYAAEQVRQLDANDPTLSREPISRENEMYHLLAALRSVAAYIEVKPAFNGLQDMQGMSEEGIRLWLSERNWDAEVFRAFLQAHGEMIEHLLDQVNGAVWDHLEELRRRGAQIAADNADKRYDG